MSCFNIGFSPISPPSIPPIPGLPNPPPLPAPPTLPKIGFSVPVPNIPSINLVAPLFYGPDITSLFSNVTGLVPCCHFQLTLPGLNEYIGLLNAAVAAQMVGFGPAIQPIIMTVNEVVLQIETQIQMILNKIPPCPSSSINITQ